MMFFISIVLCEDAGNCSPQRRILLAVSHICLLKNLLTNTKRVHAYISVEPNHEHILWWKASSHWLYNQLGFEGPVALVLWSRVVTTLAPTVTRQRSLGVGQRKFPLKPIIIIYFFLFWKALAGAPLCREYQFMVPGVMLNILVWVSPASHRSYLLCTN